MHDARPTRGKVSAVTGSPGPASGVVVTVLASLPGGGNVTFNNVRMSNRVHADVDVVVTPGSKVFIDYIGNAAEFWVDWLPKTTECVAPNPFARRGGGELPS